MRWPWAKDRVGELLAALDELAAILAEGGDEHWREWMRASAAEIRAGDAHGLDRLLGAFGGAGSLNDIGWGGARMDRLRTRIFELATELRRELR
ncbi:MAG TPA: hypothetical protein VEX86_28280 [Longimicrobium sp.]|nr:hypothetical protein [Longimicrobium sp.]